ncbi:4289_t:CDS:2, partial [Diversispora eburnea]
RSEDEEAETFEESDEEFDIFGELPEIELFKFNKENYINAQITLENEIVNQLIPSSLPLSSTTLVEEVNELSYILDLTIYKNFSPCVLIDYFNNKLQICGQTTNVRNICHCELGCKNHLWNIWRKNIQIPCIGLYTCDAIYKYQGISKIVFDDASTVRYICNNCYESY